MVVRFCEFILFWFDLVVKIVSKFRMYSRSWWLRGGNFVMSCWYFLMVVFILNVLMNCGFLVLLVFGFVVFFRGFWNFL